MSNFKRLTNLAKGKVKSIFNPTDGGTPDLDRELDEMSAKAEPRPEVRRSSAPRSEKHRILDKLLQNGLLSPEEYDQKLAALEGRPAPSPPDDDEPKPRAPRKAKKRRL